MFVFGVFAIVALAVEAMDPSARSRRTFADVYRIFSLVTLFVTVAVANFLVPIFLVRLMRELGFTLRDLYRRKRALGEPHILGVLEPTICY